MAIESGKEAKDQDIGQDPVEAFTDDLIREFLTEAGQSVKSSARGKGGGLTALLETVTTSQRGPSRASMLERVLLAQAIAAELADAIAPILAETLAPEIVRALEHYTTDEPQHKERPPSARSRRTEQK